MFDKILDSLWDVALVAVGRMNHIELTIIALAIVVGLCLVPSHKLPDLLNLVRRDRTKV